MRVSFLNLFWTKPAAKLDDSRQQLLIVENDPRQFSQELNYRIQTLLYYNQYDEAARLIHYFKNRGRCRQDAIQDATDLVTSHSEMDKIKDFAEYNILLILVFLLNSMSPPFAPRKDMPEEAREVFIVFKALLGALLVSRFLMYKRNNLLEKDSVEKKQASTSEGFKRDFISEFTKKLAALFENGVATVEGDAEQVRFEFQAKALGENPHEFHKLLVNNPAAAAYFLENAFGEHLINVIPDTQNPTKIHVMVKYRSSEQCRQLVNHIKLPFFELDTLSEVASQAAVPSRGFGQRA